MIYHSLFGL